MSTLRYIGAVEDDRVVVEAGAKWSDVLRTTLAQGKTPPCSPSTSSCRSAAP
jgi:FAD/FMN-containing dehydrogenase